MYDRALKNLAAPKLLPMRPRIKANVGQKILNKAFAQQVELPDTSYDFFLRLQCAVPDAQHRVPVHAVKKRLLCHLRHFEATQNVRHTQMRYA